MDGSRVFDDSTGLEGAVAGARIEALPRRDLKVAISTISFGFEPYAFFDGHNRVSTFSARPDRNDLPDLIDVITRGQDDGHVLAVYPAWQREPATSHTAHRAATDCRVPPPRQASSRRRIFDTGRPRPRPLWPPRYREQMPPLPKWRRRPARSRRCTRRSSDHVRSE
jgi:hypothetical protein